MNQKWSLAQITSGAFPSAGAVVVHCRLLHDVAEGLEVVCGRMEV